MEVREKKFQEVRFLRQSGQKILMDLTILSQALKDLIDMGNIDSNITLGAAIEKIKWMEKYSEKINRTKVEGNLLTLYENIIKITIDDKSGEKAMIINRNLKFFARELLELNMEDFLIIDECAFHLNQSLRYTTINSRIDFNDHKTPIINFFTTGSLKESSMQMHDFIELTLKWCKTNNYNCFIGGCKFNKKTIINNQMPTIDSGNAALILLNNYDVYAMAKKLNNIENIKAFTEKFNDYITIKYQISNNLRSWSMEDFLTIKDEGKIRIPSNFSKNFIKDCNSEIPAMWSIEMNWDLMINEIEKHNIKH